MTVMLPSVAILTPSLGYSRFIADTLMSVEQQCGVSVRHLVQDGGSKDGTVELLQVSPNVDWRSEPDSGQSDALNRALERADQTWIGWLNADEFLLPDALFRLVLAAEANEADVAFGDTVFVDEAGKFLRLVPQHRHSSLVLRTYGIAMGTCATVIRRQVLDGVRFDTTLRRLMDWDLMLRLDREGCRFVHVAVPVGVFRVHPARVTAQPASTHSDEYIRITQRYGVRMGATRRAGRLLHGVLKLRDGAYIRQLRARSFRGQDFRWFASDKALDSITAFRRAAYRTTADPSNP